jgi:hypothetical protein
MHGLGYNIETGIVGRRCSQRSCPTLSHISAAGGAVKMRADWAFVSPVSPNPKLIKDYRTAEWRRHGRALVGAMPRTPRQAGRAQRIQVFVVRQQGRDTGGTAETLIGALRGGPMLDAPRLGPALRMLGFQSIRCRGRTRKVSVWLLPGASPPRVGRPPKNQVRNRAYRTSGSEIQRDV